jgi:hypothetical protein
MDFIQTESIDPLAAQRDFWMSCMSSASAHHKYNFNIAQFGSSTADTLLGFRSRTWLVQAVEKNNEGWCSCTVNESEMTGFGDVEAAKHLP